MKTSDKIYVAGHKGLVGSAIMRCLEKNGYENLLFRSHKQLDLMNQEKVSSFFHTEKPRYVILAAAKVGGIQANSAYPADFIYNNLTIQSNVIHAAWRSGVKRLLFLGSSCIYPRECPQPMRESHLLSGPLEPTNRPYAVAKIAGIEMCWAFNRQFGTKFLAAMPTNLYGPGDNYDLENSHVLPALIRKMHEAKTRGDKTVNVWGTGKALREFLYSDDLADACLLLMNISYDKLQMGPDQPPLVNIGYGEEISIGGLVETVKAVVDFQGDIDWDSTKPDGTPRKLLDVTRMNKLGWSPKTSLREGIKKAYEDYLGSISG